MVEPHLCTCVEWWIKHYAKKSKMKLGTVVNNPILYMDWLGVPSKKIYVIFRDIVPNSETPPLPELGTLFWNNIFWHIFFLKITKMGQYQNSIQ